MGGIERIKLGVFGSRSLTTIKAYECLKNELLKLQKDNIEMIITSGEIDGICKFARELAKELKIPLLLYFYDYEKYFKSAFDKRSKQIIDSSTFLLVIHDGVSKGTLHEIELLKKFNKPYNYIQIRIA